MGEPSFINTEKLLYGLVIIAVLLNFTGLFVTIMGTDGTLYADIAKTMVVRHDYINLIVKGHDWLDKPHFPFWVAALSFNLFGFTTWAYKLPAILCLLMGAAYTYAFGKSLYDKRTALLAVIILLTAQHILLSNNDVRAEAYLTGLVIASVYHFYKAGLRFSFWHILAGSVFAACSVMTKGMFALIPIGGGIVGQYAITRQWKQLFAWKWLLAIGLTLLFILPEIYCVYEQFDLHPEKLVFDTHGVSGVKFFFWDSQFGRFFNTGPIKGSGDPFFFVHTTLWAFLPWSLLLFVAIFQTIKKGAKQVQVQEWYCLSASMLTFLLFSASKFQLPHYLNIVFPFFAIITANYLYTIKKAGNIRIINKVQWALMAILLAIIALLEYYFRALNHIGLATVIIIMLLVAIAVSIRLSKADLLLAIITRTVIISCIVNVYLNFSFYSSLVKYQSGSVAAEWINDNNSDHLPLLQTDDNTPYPLEFYLRQPAIYYAPADVSKWPQKPFLLYTDENTYHSLVAKGLKSTQLKTFDDYTITRLKPKFLNQKTRAGELGKMILARVQK